uniref:Ig-like domain-containing protein n=1 Tax=Ciona savignyi TaxID=51511 RepID=H2YJ33_CIOSA
MLSDVPYKANMTRVWGGMSGRPSDTSAFGQLIKEGILHLVAEEGERCKSRHRRLFLFQNYLIVAKIHKVARTKQNDESLFDQMHETKGIMLEDDCDVRSFIIRSSSDRLGVALWSMRLECRSSAGKKSWRREIGRIIMEAKNGCKQGPLFTIKLCDVTINEGDTMHLFCYVTGIPPPEVAWMKDDVAVVTGTRMTSSSRDDGYRGIHLSNVTKEDAGKYTCCVISDASVMTSAYVTIRDGGS